VVTLIVFNQKDYFGYLGPCIGFAGRHGYFAAQHRLDTHFSASQVKLDSCKKIVVVCDCQGILSINSCLCHQIINPACSVRDGIFGVESQVCEHQSILNKEIWQIQAPFAELRIQLKCQHKGKIMANQLIKHITDNDFENIVIESKDTVLVDFWAEWCGPCKMIAPVLDEAANTFEGKLKIAKMNVDENRDIPAKFGIRGIPTLMLFKDGQLAATKVGAMSKAQLNEFIQQQLA
jgi:thioredoxin 1